MTSLAHLTGHHDSRSACCRGTMKTPLHANFDALSGKKQKELPTSYNFLVIA